jgi:hypothetical protein
MDEITEQQPKNHHQSLLYWILRFVIGANLGWYFFDVVIYLIRNLNDPEETITLQSILLGNSENWSYFLNVRILGSAIFLIGAIAGWGWELYRQKKTN